MSHMHINTVKTARRSTAEAAVSLSKRRRWFTQNNGEQGNNAGQNGSGTSNTAGSGASTAGSQNTEHMIPKTRFDEVNDRAQKAEAALKKFQDDTAANEQERLKKQGEWLQIAENEKKRALDLEAKAARADVLEQGYVESNKRRIEQIPEVNRSLVAMLVGKLPAEEVAAYLDANWQFLTQKAAPDLDQGAGGGSGGGSGGAAVVVTEADKQQAEAAKAQGYNITPEQVAARRQKK